MGRQKIGYMNDHKINKTKQIRILEIISAKVPE
jgi:hypothetical protein